VIPPERVAAAEYAKRRALATVTETRFGSFVHDADHEGRAAATQLVDTELPSHAAAEAPAQSPVSGGVAADTTAEALLDRLEKLYERHDLPHRVVSGVDRETFARLEPVLRERGYERELYWALVPTLHESDEGPERLRIEAKPHGSADARAVHEAVDRDAGAVAYAADVARALDGTELVGYRDGDPVGVAGWYVHGEGEEAVARYTHVGTHPDAAGEGVGSALVSAVVERCPLPRGRQVVCATEPNTGFYEGLGFTRNNHLWRFARLP
jgi:GNAT superfamily N-acetyltransferase